MIQTINLWIAQEKKITPNGLIPITNTFDKPITMRIQAFITENFKHKPNLWPQNCFFHVQLTFDGW